VFVVTRRVSQSAGGDAPTPLSRGNASHPAEFAKENNRGRQPEEYSPDAAASGARRIEGLTMNTCHVERSETSLHVNWRTAFPKDLRRKAWPRGLGPLRCSFAALRMTNREP